MCRNERQAIARFDLDGALESWRAVLGPVVAAVALAVDRLLALERGVEIGVAGAVGDPPEPAVRAELDAGATREQVLAKYGQV